MVSSVNSEAAERYARLRRLGEALKEVFSNMPFTSPQADPPSPFVRSKEARVMLGGRGVVDRCERAGWFVPVQRSKRMTLYRRIDIEAAAQRIAWGELP